MITDAFDNSEVLFGTKDFYGEQKHLCDKCMVVFSEQIFEYMLDTYEHQEVGAIRCCNGITPVYVFDIEGMKITGYLSHIGSALAGGDVIEANWLTGAVKFIMFGSAGSLDSGLTTGKFVIPTHSYREEGLSYHYAPPADYIEVKNAKIVKAIFDELKYLFKGIKILVEGRMQNDNYKNRAGENVYGMRLMIEEISFAESKKALESGNDEREEAERETRASSNRNRSDRAENQRSASRSTRSGREEVDDRDYDREREDGRYRSNTRAGASDDRRRSNSGGTRSRGTSARSRERSQDIDDRYMETDDEKLDFD